MLKTRSGLPAYDAETMQQARIEQQKFYDAISHLQHCSDFDRLIVPNIKTFMKHDIINPIHPVALACNMAAAAEKSDEDKVHQLKQDLETGEITQARFDWEMRRVELAKLERKAEFDKSPELRKEIKARKKTMKPFVEPEVKFD